MLWWILAIALSQRLPVLHYHGPHFILHWKGKEHVLENKQALGDLLERNIDPSFDKGLLLINMDWPVSHMPALVNDLLLMEPRCVTIAVSSPQPGRYREWKKQKEATMLVMNVPNRAEFRQM
jgi:hypothetical protein